MWLRTGILVFVCLFMAQVMYSQDCHLHVSGKIVDAENELPISYSVVTVKGTNMGAYSDSLGNFHIDGICKGTFTLVCSRIGFNAQEKQIQVEDDVEVDFNLVFNPSVFRVIDVVDAVATEKSVEVQSELKGRDLFQTRGNNLGESLKNVTGVTTLNTGAGISKPAIHGLHSNRVLILNNGIRQEGQQWGNEHAPEIDPFIADKITVIKGASSLRYGSDAIAGVILTEPRELGKYEGLSGEVNLVGMSNGRQGVASAFIEYSPQKIKGLSARIQGTLKQGGNFSTPNYFLKNTGIKEHNYSADAQYQRKRFKIQLYYSQFNTQIGILSASHIGNLTDLRRAIASNVPLETSGFGYAIERPYQQIEHELFKAKSEIDLKSFGKLSFVYARQYNLRQEYDKHKPLNDSLAALNRPALQLEMTTHTANVVWEKKTKGAWKHSAGINGLHQANTYTGRFFIPNYYNNGIGAFYIEQWHRNKWTLEGGLRYDVRDLRVFLYENKTWNTFEHNYSQVSASVVSQYNLNEQWNFTLQTGSAWRPPQASELYSNGLHHGASAIENGNRNLTEERAYSTIANVQFTNKRFSIEVSPYLNYINGFIFLSPTGIPTLTIRGAYPTFQYEQTNALLHGADINASLSIKEQLNLRWKTALVRAENVATKEFIYGIPADRHELKCEYQLEDKNHFKETYFSISGMYVNKQWRASDVLDYMPTPNAYFILTAEFTTAAFIGKQRINIGISVNNLLNESYRDYMNRFRYYTDEIGRNVALRINIPFHSTRNQS